MAWLIVAPLEAGRQDLARIETLRRRHDPTHSVIGAHVTLVFPFEGLDLASVRRHLAALAENQGEITVRLSSYLAVRAHDDRQSHVFMVPDLGRAEIEDLHDRLYTGPLAGALRPEIPFIPHVTVAAVDDQYEAESLARRLGQVGLPARLTALELISFQDGAVDARERFALAG